MANTLEDANLQLNEDFTRLQNLRPAAQITTTEMPTGTAVPVAQGGTGAGTAAGARSNLGAAPNSATYITKQAESELSTEQSLGALTTGLLKNTVAVGVGALSTATEGTDYYKPGGTDVAVADGGTGASTAANARTNLGIQDIATKKCNFGASAGPTVNDDTTLGYSVGSIWTGTVLAKAYLCLDATTGAAVWAQFSAL